MSSDDGTRSADSNTDLEYTTDENDGDTNTEPEDQIEDFNKLKITDVVDRRMDALRKKLKSELLEKMMHEFQTKAQEILEETEQELNDLNHQQEQEEIEFQTELLQLKEQINQNLSEMEELAAKYNLSEQLDLSESNTFNFDEMHINK